MGTNIVRRKYLFVVPNDNLGGAENILKMLANRFQKEQVDVVFLTQQKSNAWASMSSQVNLRYGSFDSEYLGALQLIFNFLVKWRKEEYTHTFSSHVFVTGIVGFMIRCRLLRTRYYIARESTLIFKRFKGFKLSLYKLMYWIGYPAVDLLICQTNYMKDELIKALPHLEKRLNIKVIPNPIDLESVSNTAVLKNELLHEIFLVSAGRLIPEKGFDILIRVFKDLKIEFPHLKLVILGEGYERDNLIKLATMYNIDKDVLFEGFIGDVYPYFKAAKVCVVSSRVEGFPNVLLQMMSQNTSVVSTLCAGGIEEIEGLYTANVENELDLFRSIRKALTEDSASKRTIFDRILKERSISRFLENIEEELDAR